MKQKVSYIYNNRCQLQYIHTVHMIQLQQSTKEVTYTSTLTYLIYMNTYLPIQFYRLLQMTTTTPKDMKELHSSSSNPKQNIYNLKYSV